MSQPLLESVVLSDASLAKKPVKMSAAESMMPLSWISAEMAFHVSASTFLAAVVYVAHSFVGYPISSGAFLQMHGLLGAILGFLLVGRVVLGLQRVSRASKLVSDFNKTCTQMAVLSTFVVETLTVSAGAEIEKAATSTFKHEVVRLLNVAFYCYTLMLNGMKLFMPPSSLKSGKRESEILSAVDNPTIMVCKMLASLLEQQRAAKRISNEQTAVLMGKISDLIDTYYASLSMVIEPTPSGLSSLTYCFTILFAYTLGPVIAVREVGENVQFASLGLSLTIFYTFIISLFLFGLHEAGKMLGAPLKAIAELIATDEMGYTLSDELSSVIDDEDVPVFLPRP
jgi:predicted membrane chloride channel (bestrophin family)